MRWKAQEDSTEERSKAIVSEDLLRHNSGHRNKGKNLLTFGRPVRCQVGRDLQMRYPCLHCELLNEVWILVLPLPVAQLQLNCPGSALPFCCSMTGSGHESVFSLQIENLGKKKKQTILTSQQLFTRQNSMVLPVFATKTLVHFSLDM